MVQGIELGAEVRDQGADVGRTLGRPLEHGVHCIPFLTFVTFHIIFLSYPTVFIICFSFRPCGDCMWMRKIRPDAMRSHLG
jgi:hypothetical protein